MLRLFLGLLSLSASAAIHRPADGTELATALTNVACGDTIVIKAANTYRRSTQTISNKPCTASTQIIIEGDRIGELPADKRLTWAQRSLLPVIESTSANPALSIGTNVSHLIIRGVAFSNYWPTSATTTSDLVSSDGAVIAPRNVTFDRVMIYPYEEVADYGYPFRSAERGITITGTEIAVENSYITGFYGWYRVRAQQAITSVSGGATTTLNFTSVHGWGASGTRVIYIEGGTGSWTGINGKRTATIVDTDTVTIAVDSSGFGGTSDTFTARDIHSDALTLSRGITVPSGPGPYRVINNYIAAQYTSTFWGGATTVFTPNEAEVTASSDGTHLTLSQTRNLAVGDMISISPNVLRVSTITTANPAVITFTRAHGLGSAGATYKLYFLPGSPTATATNGIPPSSGSYTGGWNGIYQVNTVTVVDSTRVSVAVNSSAFTAYASSQAQASYGGMVAYDVNQSTNTINGCTAYNAGQGSEYCNYKVTSISGNDLVVAPFGASGNGRSGAFWVSARARWNGNNISNVEMRRNLFIKEPGWCSGDFVGSCKGYDEIKSMSNGIVDGNVSDDSLGTGIGAAGGMGLGPPRNQGGTDPWLSVNGMRVSNNRGRFSVVGAGSFDEIRTIGISRTMPPIVYENNTYLGTDAYCFKANSPMQLVYTHNTCWPEAYSGNSYNSWIQFIECGTYSGPGSIQLGGADARIIGNIGKWNYYGTSADGSNCRDSSTLTYNVLIDNLGQAAASGLPGVYFSNTNAWPANATAAGMTAGTCDWANWRNCRIASGSYIGTAPGGKTPGSDVEQSDDHENGWSEDAGLIRFASGYQGRENNPAAWQIGSTRAAMTFRRINSGACSLIVYTNAIRTTAHGDTDTSPEQACDRSGNVVGADGTITFVLGGNTALTASTTYHYKLTIGTAVMVGSFSTKASGSGTELRPGCSGQISANADMSSPTAFSASPPTSISTNTVRYWRCTGGAVQVVIAN